MSVRKWRWTPDCDKGICLNDCDKCDKADFEEETEGETNEDIQYFDGDRIYLSTDFRVRS